MNLKTDFIIFAASSRRLVSLSLFHFFPAVVNGERAETKVIEEFRTFLILCEDSCVSQCNEHGSLGISYPELAFQTADDILCFTVLTCCQQLGDDGYFLRLRLVTG